MGNVDHDEHREVQHAEVIINVALPVDVEASEDERKKAINRKLRLSNMADRLELRPGLTADAVRLNYTETIDEAIERKMGEAEAAHEAELDRKRERYFDRRGHF